MLSKSELLPWAEAIDQAERERKAIPAISAKHPDLTLDEARDIQLMNVARRLRDGQRVVGYKLGLTSREAQKHFKVFRPDFGHLFDPMSVLEESEIDLSELIAPKIEGEIAFVMSKDLKGPGITVADAVSSIEYALAAFEIIDCRFQDWKVTAADLVADNGASSRFVLAGSPKRICDLDLPAIGMALSMEGEVQLTAAGSAVMGNPLNAVVFLANELGKMGRGLSAGDLILSGSLGGMLNAQAGKAYTAEFAQLGSVSVRFKGKELR